MAAKQMSKKEFLDLAPEYYGIAILDALVQKKKTLSKSQILDEYMMRDEYEDEYYYLGKEVLFDAAIRWLDRQWLITIHHDPFGPDLFSLSEVWNEVWNKISIEPGGVAQKWDVTHDRNWLLAALDNVDKKYDELGITEQDTINVENSTDAEGDEWQPIPLERPDALLDGVTRSLDETIELLRCDNGYTATLPEERNFVLSTLTSANKRLKEEATISYGWLKVFAIDPLLLLIKRHKDAALGIAGEVALAALKEYLKSKATQFLSWL
jgi:hypothetical protein